MYRFYKESKDMNDNTRAIVKTALARNQTSNNLQEMDMVNVHSQIGSERSTEPSSARNHLGCPFSKEEVSGT
jgi:hypothetical protein